MELLPISALLAILAMGAPGTLAVNGDSSKLTLVGLEGWKTFEVITQDDNNGVGYTVPGELDGLGAFLVDGGTTLRVLVNHETGRACDTTNEATVTEVDLDLTNFQRAVSNMIINNNLGGEHGFVRRFRRAYDLIVNENGEAVTSLSRRLRLFCSSQAYSANPFGIEGEGFQDQIYIVGEEQMNPPFGRLFAIDSMNRIMYQISGRTGDASGLYGGIGGMPWDSFENVALIRTFEKDHIALLLSIDGGSKMLKLYVGQKNKGRDGQSDSTDFLARNGLAYGSWFYLKGSLPFSQGETRSGFFHTNSTDALTGEKFEDVDTNPLDPRQVVLGAEKNGVLVFTFSLQFVGSKFQSDATGSPYTITMIVKDSDSPINQADNVAWTASDLIYVTTDGKNGAIWEMDSNGNNQVNIAKSINNATDFNPSGIIDISRFVGYVPASILLSNTMNCGSSMSVIINPDAQLVTTKKPTLSPVLAPSSPYVLITKKPSPAPVLAPVSQSVLITKKPTSAPALASASQPDPILPPPSSDDSCLSSLCPAVLGLGFLGQGDLLHRVWGDECSETCFFRILKWLLLVFGWQCGPCTSDVPVL